MKIIIPLIISSLIFLGSLFAAHAEAPLNQNDIQHFINAMKPLQKLGEKHDFGKNKTIAPENMKGIMFSPMSRSLKEVKGHKAYGEFKTIIHNAGFSSPQEWANVGDRIMRGYIALKTQDDLTPEKRHELQQSIEEINKNEYLSPEMKKQLLGSMTQMLAMADNNMSENSKADQKTLKPYLTKLDRLFEDTK